MKRKPFETAPFSYSSGPNPYLTEFVLRNTTPYDTATDRYEVEAFTDQVRATKATPLYKMHTYWSKKPHEAMRRYIEHYTQPGDLVLDPFCGSGGTALMALALGRKAIAIDLSRAATFISKHYCTSIDLGALEQAFRQAIREVRGEADWLYETRCDRCGGKAITSYVIYSEVFRCPRGWEKVPLHDCRRLREEYLVDGRRKRRMAWFCPEHGERLDTRGERLGAIPVESGYLCQGGGRNPGGAPCRPTRGVRVHNDEDLVRREHFQRYDLGKIAEIEAASIPYWCPTAKLPARALSHRLAGRGVRTVDKLFTKRNLWALSLFLHQARCHPDESIRSALEFLSSSVLLVLSRMLRAHHSGFLGSFYFLPDLSRENNVFATLERKFANFLRAKREINELLEASSPGHLLISTQSSLDLSGIAEGSVDYIFTDPPYGSRVPFWELNQIWEFWLGFDTSWNEDEIIVNKYQNKGFEDWARMMGQALKETHRVLKPGRWLTLCYHDTSEVTWKLLGDLTKGIGFLANEGDQAVFIETAQKPYKQRREGEEILKRDLVISFQKPERRLWAGWSSLEEAPLSRLESEKEEAAAHKLGEFIEEKRKGEFVEGVGYSELFENYLYAVKDKPHRELRELLADYFIPTTGGWRNPETEEERERLAEARQSGINSRICRFLKALDEGRALKPAEIPDNESLATWLHHAYLSGMWKEGKRIFEQGGIDLSLFDEGRRYEIWEDYESCLAMYQAEGHSK